VAKSLGVEKYESKSFYFNGWPNFTQEAIAYQILKAK
jgi:hypothetical protein